MKKVINNKLYNTDTARLIGCDPNDDCSGGEILYRKRTGEFFISDGSKIRPLSWDDACIWAKEHLDADIFEKVFGEVTKDETKKVFPLNVKVSLLEKVKRSASQHGISASAVIETVLEDYFSKSE